MSHRELFSEFLENLNLDLKQAKKISYHYRKITKSLNLAFRGTSSRVANRLKVGSVGRHTAIKGISDLDTQPHPVFIPPENFDTRTGFVNKDEGGSPMPYRPEFILYILRQCVDAPAHVNRFNYDEDIIRTEHI